MVEYGESICKAIDEIASKRISQIKCDITKSCKIIDLIEQHNIYKYLVSDGAMEFEAYGTHGFYEKGSFVLVQIPQGNYSLTKTIIGRDLNKENANGSQMLTSIGRDTEPYMRWETVNNKIFSLTANGEIKEINVLTINNLKDFLDYGYNQFSISGDFFANLKKKNVEGKFGIKILMLTSRGEISYSFNNADMIDNGFYYDSFFRQRKTFAINAENLDIKSIKIIFYQEKDSFKYQNTNSEKEEIKPGIVENLFVKNLQLILGKSEINQNDSNLILGYSLEEEKQKRLIDISNIPFIDLQGNQEQKKISFNVKGDSSLTIDIYCLYE